MRLKKYCKIVLKCIMWAYLMAWIFVMLRHQNAATSPSPFERATSSAVFVDKTNLIKEIISSDFHYWLITCPRGFGKSTNHDMLKRFFEISMNSDASTQAKNQTDNYKLFTNPNLQLQITKRPDVFEKHFGEYIVFSLDLNIQNASTYREIVDAILEQIRQLYNDYKWVYDKYLAKQLISFSLARKIFKRMYSNHATEEDIGKALGELSRVVQHYLKKPTFLLIDNYDTSTWTALHKGLDTYRVHRIIKTLVQGALLQNTEYIDRAVIVGISGMFAHDTVEKKKDDVVGVQIETTHMAQIEITTPSTGMRISPEAMKDVQLATFLNGSAFDEYYGFTESEVTAVLQRSGISAGEITTIRQNYGIYNSKINKPSVYNPTTTIDYINEKTGKPTKRTNYSESAAFVVLVNCLKHRNQRTIIQELILSRSIGLRYQHVLSTERDIRTLENTLNPATHCNECNGRTYISYLYEIGYVTNMNKGHIGTVNQQIQSLLEHHLHEYFVRTVRIEESILKRIAHSLHEIADQLTTGNETKEEFRNSLLHNTIQEYVFDEQQPFGYIVRKQDFHAILYIAASIYGRQLHSNVTSKVRVDQMPSKRIKPSTLVDEVDIVIANKNNTITLFVQISTDESLKTIAQHISRYVPKSGHEQAKYVKYLAIVARKNEVLLDFPPVAEYVDGHWQNVKNV